MYFLPFLCRIEIYMSQRLCSVACSENQLWHLTKEGFPNISQIFGYCVACLDITSSVEIGCPGLLQHLQGQCLFSQLLHAQCAALSSQQLNTGKITTPNIPPRKKEASKSMRQCLYQQSGSSPEITAELSFGQPCLKGTCGKIVFS